jgi:hypothetical protein
VSCAVKCDIAKETPRKMKKREGGGKADKVKTTVRMDESQITVAPYAL